MSLHLRAPAERFLSSASGRPKVQVYICLYKIQEMFGQSHPGLSQLRTKTHMCRISAHAGTAASHSQLNNTFDTR